MGKILCRVVGGGSSVGTATTADVISGKTFSNDNDVELTGTLSGSGTATESDVLKGTSFYSVNLQNKLNGSLELTGNASEGDVISGKTFYNTNAKSRKSGTLADYASGTDAQSCTLYNNYIYYRILKGAYRATWSGNQTEVRYPATSVIAALGISSITSFKVAQYGANRLRFTWAKPSRGLWSGIRIVGKLNSWPTSVTDGNKFWDSGSNYCDSGWIDTGTWYFRVYSYITWTGGRYYKSSYDGSTSIYNTTDHGNKTVTGSSSWTVPNGCSSITAFLVGGGGGISWAYIANQSYAISSGGGGGYTKTQSISVTPGETLNIVVGAGGSGNGGMSGIYRGSTLLASANGGSAGVVHQGTNYPDVKYRGFAGCAGGSGGGGCLALPTTTSGWAVAYAGAGGSDGSNGGDAAYSSTSSVHTTTLGAGGSGQGYSTKAWGTDGEPYAPGGSGSYLSTSYDGGRGKAGAGLTGNNSGAAHTYTQYHGFGTGAEDAGSYSGSSGVVLLKW